MRPEFGYMSTRALIVEAQIVTHLHLAAHTKLMRAVDAGADQDTIDRLTTEMERLGQKSARLNKAAFERLEAERKRSAGL